MLYDRPYMRESRPGTSWSPLGVLITAIITGFVLQHVFGRWFGSSAFDTTFALSAENIRKGYLWTLLTYPFLHGTGGIFHILANLLGLFFLGREVLATIGGRRFYIFFFVSALAGGLTWLAINFNRGGYVLGASAAVYGLLALFACFNPNRPITFLLFFIVPITIKPKYIAFGLAGIDLFGLLFRELPGGTFGPGIAHSAHLGGMLCGVVYYRWFHGVSLIFRSSDGGPVIELPSWLQRRSTRKKPPRYPYTVNVERDRERDIRAEVDRILDKINTSGFGALTDEEKKTLDDARDMLSKR